MYQFANLLRLNKPIGIFLLFWPCTWSLAMAQWYVVNNYLFIKYLILFFVGSVIMRSAGCVYNDIVDKKIDIKVQRTKKRLIAAGKITTKTAWLIILLLLIPAFIILFQFNNFSKILGLSSGLLIITYPFMKRITFWPQLFLGFTFNWGVLLGWSVFFENLTIEIIILYMAGVFWTLGYDTIYALQDTRDDLRALSPIMASICLDDVEVFSRLYKHHQNLFNYFKPDEDYELIYYAIRCYKFN